MFPASGRSRWTPKDAALHRSMTNLRIQQFLPSWYTSRYRLVGSDHVLILLPEAYDRKLTAGACSNDSPLSIVRMMITKGLYLE